MPQTVPEIEIGKQSGFMYSSNLEHLSDEMKRLDLLIRLKLLERNETGGTSERFKGLVLSKEEIDALLSDYDAEGAVLGNSSEKQTIIDSLESLKSQIENKTASSLKAGVYLALPHISDIFALTPFETRCLLVCLAPEIDRKYDSLFAYLQNDITRKKPSIDLLLNLLCSRLEERLVARQAFDPRAPLVKYRLFETTENSFDGPVSLLSRSAKLDDRAVSFLLGFKQVDARLDGLAQLVSSEASQRSLPVDDEIRERIKDFVSSQFNNTQFNSSQSKRREASSRSLVFFFSGPTGSGKRELATAVCRDLDLRLIIGNVARMLDAELPFDEAVWRLGREAALQDAAVCLEEFDSLLTAESGQACLNSLVEVIDCFPRLFFLIGNKNWNPRGKLGEGAFIHLDFPTPDEAKRKRLWEERLQTDGLLTADCDAAQLASGFKLTAGQIQDALRVALTRARWRSTEEARVTMKDLYAACHAQADLQLGAMARKIEPAYKWDDIVLPPDQMAQLDEICNQARTRHTVYNDWGFGRKLSLGKGLTSLFSGPPGTGKTMAAEVIASQLQLDLYKIDLSQVVSKYIGETEKNLHQVFNGAQSHGAILFFDEADALFGKRSEVKDAHDRYANIEVGYLLQKMEEYDGIAILATNLRQNMDSAFARRMRFIVEFPFPDEEYRRRIWKTVFPPEAPVALADEDFARLAREIGLAGGNIRNIALAAAFSAAGEKAAIQMSHVLQASRREHQKLGRA
jgi:ATP-dependent 26S proteasome regulatory subunit